MDKEFSKPHNGIQTDKFNKEAVSLRTVGATF